MSAITTWGWGAQGGLIATLGWGGHATIPPLQGAVGLPCRPEIVASDALTPALTASLIGEDVPLLVGADELRPRLTAQDDGLAPEVGNTDVLRPKIVDTESDC